MLSVIDRRLISRRASWPVRSNRYCIDQPSSSRFQAANLFPTGHNRGPRSGPGEAARAQGPRYRRAIFSALPPRPLCQSRRVW